MTLPIQAAGLEKRTPIRPTETRLRTETPARMTSSAIPAKVGTKLLP